MKFPASMTRIGCLLLIITGPAWSQSFTAAVRGVVTDPTGAAVVDAKIIITEAERNVQHLTTTDAQGRYQASALQPGQYTLTVEANGFRKYSQRAFPLLVQQQATIDIQLQLGDVSSVVEVQSSAPLVNTTISNLGQVIENKYIQTGGAVVTNTRSRRARPARRLRSRQRCSAKATSRRRSTPPANW